MSNHELVKVHENRELHLVLSEKRKGRKPRTLYVSTPINILLTDGAPTQRERVRWAVLKAALRVFVDGREIRVRRPECIKDEGEPSHMATLPLYGRPWEFRTGGDAAIRLFGMFYDLDFFIALTWGYREKLTSEGFQAASRECEAAWARLNIDSPIEGVIPNAYLTNARLVPE